MSQTIEQLGKAFHDILKAENNAAGRKKVSNLLQEALKDQAFVAKYIPDDTPERKKLYEDAELGFCILAHHYQGAKTSGPHDHGPYWAIYGQAEGETEMRDYQLIEKATAEKPAHRSLTRTWWSSTPSPAAARNAVSNIG